jgi:carbohydrate diacid regulator
LDLAIACAVVVAESGYTVASGPVSLGDGDVLESLLRDLLNYDPDNLADLTARAEDFGFDLTLPRQAVVVDIAGGRCAGQFLAASPDSRGVPQSARHLVFHVVDDSRGLCRHDVDRAMLGRCAQLGRAAYLGVGGVARGVGVGGVARGASAITASYAEARTALRIGAATGRPSPYDISDLRVEQMVTALPGRLRSRVTDEIIGSLRATGDWPTTRTTVLALVESGFVLVDAARSLNVHRNTLVYRLGRIAAEIGWPSTDRRRWLALYVACLGDSLPT